MTTTQLQRHDDRAIDRHLASYDFGNSHSIDVDATPEITYGSARELDLGRSPLVLALFAIRGVPHMLTGKVKPSRSIKLDTFLDKGFMILEERPSKELVLGAVGKFWRPDSGLLTVTLDEFESFDRRGYAKAVMNLCVEERPGGSLLTTETRVACTDASARRRFGIYWRAIAPFSALIRRVMLEEIKRTAERT